MIQHKHDDPRGGEQPTDLAVYMLSTPESVTEDQERILACIGRGRQKWRVGEDAGKIRRGCTGVKHRGCRQSTQAKEDFIRDDES